MGFKALDLRFRQSFQLGGNDFFSYLLLNSFLNRRGSFSHGFRSRLNDRLNSRRSSFNYRFRRFCNFVSASKNRCHRPDVTETTVGKIVPSFFFRFCKNIIWRHPRKLLCERVPLLFGRKDGRRYFFDFGFDGLFDFGFTYSGSFADFGDSFAHCLATCGSFRNRYFLCAWLLNGIFFSLVSRSFFCCLSFTLIFPLRSGKFVTSQFFWRSFSFFFLFYSSSLSFFGTNLLRLVVLRPQVSNFTSVNIPNSFQSSKQAFSARVFGGHFFKRIPQLIRLSFQVGNLI